jgi:hypothetical protein
MLEGELSSVQELYWAFRRAASRLTEMVGSSTQAEVVARVRRGERDRQQA